MPTDRKRAIEWPTVFLIVLTYLTVGLLVWNHERLPWWVILPVGGYFAALYTSLQHEVLHGHPTSNRSLNEALIFPTLHFWLPYGRYRDTHLRHHNDADLTDPRLDPESYYMLPDDWARLPGLKRSLYQFNQTLGGRMLIGPAVSIVRFWTSEFRDIAHGNRETLRAWTVFALSCAITIWFVTVIAGMPLWQYHPADCLSRHLPVAGALLLRTSGRGTPGPSHHHRRGLALLVAALPQQQPACRASQQAGARLVQAAGLLCAPNAPNSSPATMDT